MEKQYNYFYRIENTLNGKFYYGVHGTNNLEDGYFGSGKRLNYAIEKYGRENFVKENLIFFETYNQALEYEAEIVNEELVLDPSCYNLKRGGKGGGVNNGMGAEWYRENGRKVLTKSWQNPEFRLNRIKEYSERLKNLEKEGKLKHDGFKGNHHTNETKRSIGVKNKIKQTGVGNSQYGTCWVTNEKENKKIHREDLIPDGWRLGRKLNKMPP
jgi:hypothetical protein